MSKICPECGKSFVGSTKYCSYRCCKRHNRKAKEIKHPDPPKGVSIIRAFSCKECGHEVLVWERTDKRTVFCCSLCEKKYWKHNTSKSNKHRKRRNRHVRRHELREPHQKRKEGSIVTGEEYTAFLRARKPEVYVQNSSGVPVKWIVTRAYTNGVSAKRHIDAENYSHDDTGFFPVAMLMTKEQAAKRREEIAEKAKPLQKICAGCGAIFRAKGGEKYCKTCMKKGVTWGIE